MPVQPVPAIRLKAAVTVTAMAKCVKLSRSQFYDYVRRGVFPQPCRLASNKRPYYTADAQQAILEVRQTGIGCNGEFVLFYERSHVDVVAASSRRSRTAPTPISAGVSTAHLLSGLSSLGLTGLTPEQIGEALVRCFPSGHDDQDEASVLRTLNRHLRCATRVPLPPGDGRLNVRPPAET